jgi:hypothetical protein
MNIERAVIEDPEARIKAAILKQVTPPLQRIQNFHDGLTSLYPPTSSGAATPSNIIKPWFSFFLS